MLFWCVSEVSLHLRRFAQSVHDNSVTMRTTARNIVWYLLCCIFAGNVFFACTKPVSVTGDRDVYYREAKDLILTRPLSFQVFETVDPLMNAFLRENDSKNILELLPVWKKIVEQYYDNQLNGMLAYYSVELDVAGMEKQVIQVEGKLVQRRMEIIILILVVLVLMMAIVWGILYWRHKKRQLRTLFETLMRRYISWREMELYLKSEWEKHSLPPDVTVVEDGAETEDDASQPVMNDESVADAKGDEFYREL